MRIFTGLFIQSLWYIFYIAHIILTRWGNYCLHMTAILYWVCGVICSAIMCEIVNYNQLYPVYQFVFFRVTIVLIKLLFANTSVYYCYYYQDFYIARCGSHFQGPAVNGVFPMRVQELNSVWGNNYIHILLW